MKKLWIPADVSINCFCCHPEACLNLLSTSNYEVNREALINNTSGGEGGIMKNRIFITLTSVLLVVLAVIFVVAQGAIRGDLGAIQNRFESTIANINLNPLPTLQRGQSLQ